MTSRDFEAFNKRIDEPVENVISQDLLTPEFRKEYIKATNLYRRVARNDIVLATELMVSTIMLSYQFIKGMVKEVFDSKLK